MSVSYLKAICARSWGHIEAFEDLRTAKNKLTATLFLIHNQKNHPDMKVGYKYCVVAHLHLLIKFKLKPILTFLGGKHLGHPRSLKIFLKVS